MRDVSALLTLLAILLAYGDAHDVHPLARVNVRRAHRSLKDDATVTASPLVLEKTRDWVTVSWSSAALLQEGAFVAAYSPADVLLSEEKLSSTSCVKYQSVNGTSGSVRFSLLNLRDEAGYGFGLFEGGVDNPALVAYTQDAVTFAGNAEPTQVHLALTSEPTEMRVSWTSGLLADAAPSVTWWPADAGTDSTAESASRQGSTVTFGKEDFCGEPATTVGYHDAGLLHTAVMTGLQPGKPYSYIVGDDKLKLYTAPVTFAATAPSFDASKEAEQKIRISVFGDMGTAESDASENVGHDMEIPSLQTVSLLHQYVQPPSASSADGSKIDPVTLVLHIGDISYARGYATQWDEFMSEIEPSAAAVPWMVAVGNHERDFPDTSKTRPQTVYYTGHDSGGECGVATSFRFMMPPPSEDPYADTPWYSFNYGPVHFTVIGTEHDVDSKSPQYAFIRDDLAAVDRSKTPWLVLVGHRPMYVDSTGHYSGPCDDSDEGKNCPHDQPVANHLRNALEPLMVKYQVDLAMWGHHHSYQRTCAVVNSKCVAFSTPLNNDSNNETTKNSQQNQQEQEGQSSGGSSSSRAVGAAARKYDARQNGYSGPVHVVVGTAGKDLSMDVAHPTAPPFEYTNELQHGISILDANATALRVQFLLDGDGSVDDDFWLFRKNSSGSDSETESGNSEGNSGANAGGNSGGNNSEAGNEEGNSAGNSAGNEEGTERGPLSELGPKAQEALLRAMLRLREPAL